MQPSALILALMLIVRAAAAQETAARESWEPLLEDEPALIGLAKDLKSGLEQGDVAAFRRQFQPGKLRLVLFGSSLPPDLYAHSQAAALLEEHLRLSPATELRISLARWNASGSELHLALDSLKGRAGGVKARRDRYVAVYRQSDGAWHLAELRCP